MYFLMLVLHACDYCILMCPCCQLSEIFIYFFSGSINLLCKLSNLPEDSFMQQEIFMFNLKIKISILLPLFLC